MSYHSMFYNILILVLVLLCYIITDLVEGEQVSIPRQCRTEGKLTMIFPLGKSIIEHNLAFDESLDANTGRSTVSIGYVSHTPTTYYNRAPATSLVLNSEGVCEPAFLEHQTFIPELSWFVKRLLPDVDVAAHMSKERFWVGPTGFLELFIYMGGSEYKLAGKVDYRNIPCRMYSRLFRPEGSSVTLTIDIYVPLTGIIYRETKSSLFSVKVSAIFDNPSNGSSPKQDPITFMLDYFDIEYLDDENSILNPLKDDFNFPVGHACSRFLPQIEPKITAQSFSLLYEQYSTYKYRFLAYDHSASLLRRETIGESVSIWDLTEDLLYNINNNATSILRYEAKLDHNSQTCSVLKVKDNRLSSAYRPYEKEGESLDVLRMFGASSIAYLGREKVRDMSCIVYESILTEPPSIFGLTLDKLCTSSKEKILYIVTYYLLEGEPKVEEELSTSLKEEAFWPARITLQKLNLNNSIIEFIDQLDIFDFHWSLEGWEKRSSDLFLASECFSDQNEQVRLEMSLTVEKAQHASSSPKNNIKSLLAFNKFKLEYDLLKETSNLLGMSRMHLIDYRFKMRSDHLYLEMMVADRKDNKELVFYGDGLLPKTNAYENNRIVMTRLTEERCILLSSHIEDISLVIYCPYSKEIGDSSCVAVYSEDEPVIKNNVPSETGNYRHCRSYRFSSIPAPLKGTTKAFEGHQQLYQHSFPLIANVPGSSLIEELKGTVQDYDLSHEVSLVSINHYTYVLSANTHNPSEVVQNVRTIDSLSYESLTDCVDICNLDNNCRSYSYCSSNGVQQCLLSSLDIRAAKVQDQLVSSTLSPDDLVTILSDSSLKYQLKFLDHCNIYERDYLNMFRQTDEILRLDQTLSSQYLSAPSTFDCAKLSVDLELKSIDHHVAMFAYCPSLGANLCIMDENMFAPTANNNPEKHQAENQHELLCRVYRKKYQTYFNVSSLVLKRQSGRQLELNFNTVEDCARACWIKFGKVCTSFDFCSPGTCLINQAIYSSSTKSDFMLELHSGCLHYERDLRLDDVRSNHMIGKHQLLIRQNTEELGGISFIGFILKAFTYCVVCVAFICGLVLGRIVDDYTKKVTILSRPMPTVSALRASQRTNFAAPSNRGSFTRGLEDSLDVNSDGDSVKMSVIKRGLNENRDLIDKDS